MVVAVVVHGVGVKNRIVRVLFEASIARKPQSHHQIAECCYYVRR